MGKFAGKTCLDFAQYYTHKARCSVQEWSTDIENYVITKIIEVLPVKADISPVVLQFTLTVCADLACFG